MSYSMMGPPGMTMPAPPDQQMDTVPDLCMRLQQAILRDGLVDPEEQRAIGALMESLSQHAQNQAAQQAAGMTTGQPPEDSGTEPAFSTEGTEEVGGPQEGAEYVPYQ